MLVEDDLILVDGLTQVLEAEGFAVEAFTHGEAADTELKSEPFDLLLLDIGLPRLNGHEVCRRVREQPWGKEIVVIALTGWGQDADRRKSREAGFDGHLVKPVEYDKLLELLATLSNGA